MPIYAYRCEACGFAKDVLQKISDPQLTVCTSCGAEAFKKQVTAAGFQLKGTGWYVTDFRGGSSASSSAAPASDSNNTGDAKAASPAPTSTNSSEGNNGGSSNAASSNAKASPSTE